ncbi:MULTISPECIES: hypothetical protein [unclassified Paenibacillus]|uniref:hypothetical protein n=1 Tax=unclassified Paenibacillus TaxID=185978 RepID=UPI00383826CA
MSRGDTTCGATFSIVGRFPPQKARINTRMREYWTAKLGSYGDTSQKIKLRMGCSPAHLGQTIPCLQSRLRSALR